MNATPKPKRARHDFAPLGSSQPEVKNTNKMQLKGVVFDMDGTLCEPQNYMFSKMREAVHIPASSDILDYIHALPAPEQDDAFAKIQDIEREAMANQRPQAGLVSLMEYLDRKGLRKGICTRNFDAPVNHLLEKHIPFHLSPFGPVITRDFKPPKPSPAGILHIASAWGVIDTSNAQYSSNSSSEQPPLPILMVGDSVDDMAAGHDAGALTVFLTSPGKEELEKDERTDIVISRLDELIEILEDGIVSQWQ